MPELIIFDRKTKQKEKEKVTASYLLSFLYGKKTFAKLCRIAIARLSLFSSLIGWLLRLSFSKKLIKPFIKKYHIDEREFEKDSKSFTSFDDFFVRKLKSSSRPLNQHTNIVTLPADGRYLVFQNLRDIEHFFVKEKKFSLKKFLQDEELSTRYQDGSMVIARLNPTDCHRFFFPVDCIANKPRLINGYLYSVHPFALQQNLEIFCANKRMITTLSSDIFSHILFIEIGATNVGSIHQTFIPGQTYQKGEEKGYFSFGGSSIVMLFEKNKIVFDQDLLEMSKNNIEVKTCYGESLGTFVQN